MAEQRTLKVGVVDSGIDEPALVCQQAAFVLRDEQVLQLPSLPDRLGHGSRVVRIIQHRVPDVKILMANVFEQPRTSSGQVAAAIHWLVSEGVELINLSLGLSIERPQLKAACEAALAAGVILVAASPAQGVAVYPAAWPGVIRATGDARCGPCDWVWLQSLQADVGGCVRPLDQVLRASGASMGCAWVSAHLTSWLATQPGCLAPATAVSDAYKWLQQQARFVGVEQRGMSNG